MGCIYTIDGHKFDLAGFKEHLRSLSVDRMAKYVDGVHSVPSAPFKKTWHELAFKHALDTAVRDGYDRLTWDTGATNAERYDLSNAVDSVAFYRDNDGTYQVKAEKENHEGESETIMERRGVKPGDLEGMVGRDLAEKAINMPHQHARFDGEGLKVGGEGMKGFYDKILPDFVNKYTKKWGGKVEEGTVPTSLANETVRHRAAGWYVESLKPDGSFHNGPYFPSKKEAARSMAGSTPVHQLTITPAMREAILKEGQPLFQEGKNGPKAAVEFTEGERPVIHLFEGHDASSILHESWHIFIRSLSEAHQAIIERVLGPLTDRSVQERAARMGERYMREGKAPTPELQPVFSQFKKWLTKIYQKLIGSPLAERVHPEMRTIFDEMLGKEKEPTSKPGVESEKAGSPTGRQGVDFVRASSEAYNKGKGLDWNDPGYAPIDIEQAKKTADIYDSLPHAPNDPKVKAAYDTLKSELYDQWNHATKQDGMKFEAWTKEGQPYKDSAEMLDDVRENKHLYYFPTEGGFGSVDHTDHPMLDKMPNGMLANDMFRCFAPGTLVRTRNGFSKIEDVAVGDEVLTSAGNWRSVTKTGSRSHVGELIDITSNASLSVLSVTPEHPFWMLVGTHRPHKKSACTPYICSREYKTTGRRVDAAASHRFDWVKAGDIVDRSWFPLVVDHEVEDLASVSVPSMYWRKGANGPTVFEVNDEFLWVIGLYIAEGSMGGNGANFSLHAKEVTFINKVKEFAARHGYGVTHTRQGNGVCLKINSVVLMRWLESWVGKGAANKRIPSELLKLPPHKLLHLVQGIMDGDGRKGRGNIEQTSKLLALQLIEAAVRLGFQPTSSTIYSDNPNHHDVYRVHEVYESGHSSRQKKYTWRILGEDCRQMRVKRRPYDGLVYNLSVDGDETYVVENIPTHNCVHDYYGHAAHGYQFGPRGEEGAWRSHAQMFTPEARGALTMETKGQNSWVNFGRHQLNPEGQPYAKGEEGYQAPQDRPYAEQKANVINTDEKGNPIPHSGHSSSDYDHAFETLGQAMKESGRYTTKQINAAMAVGAPIYDRAIRFGSKPAQAVAAIADKIDHTGRLRNQMENVLTGDHPVPTFTSSRGSALHDAARWIDQYAKDNPVFNKPIRELTSQQISDGIYQHSMRELDAWTRLSPQYQSFYGSDITDHTNRILQYHAEENYGRKATPAEVQLYHLVSGLASPSTAPIDDSSFGFKIWDRYMRTGELTAEGDKRAQKFEAKGGGSSQREPVFIDNKTGIRTFSAKTDGEPNEPEWATDKQGNPRNSKISPTYMDTALQKVSTLVSKMGVDGAMKWLDSKHTVKEIGDTLGVDPKTLTSHENLNAKDPNSEAYGIFGIGNVPKVGSYILNRMQNFDTITKDMWVARTMARYSGEPLAVDGKVLGEPWSPKEKGGEGIRLRKALDDAWTRVGKERGMKPAQVQEAMWDVEQAIYGKLGASQGATYTSEGLSKGISRFGTSVPEAPAKPAYSLDTEAKLNAGVPVSPEESLAYAKAGGVHPGALNQPEDNDIDANGKTGFKSAIEEEMRRRSQIPDRGVHPRAQNGNAYGWITPDGTYVPVTPGGTHFSLAAGAARDAGYRFNNPYKDAKDNMGWVRVGNSLGYDTASPPRHFADIGPDVTQAQLDTLHKIIPKGADFDWERYTQGENGKTGDRKTGQGMNSLSAFVKNQQSGGGSIIARLRASGMLSQRSNGTYHPITRVIQLFQGRANFSTVIHELFHYYHALLLEDPEHSDLIKQHYGDLSNVEGAELFARQGEQVVLGGKLSVPDKMRPIFEAIKGWMHDVYQRWTVNGEDSAMPDNVKAIFEKDIAKPSARVDALIKQFHEDAGTDYFTSGDTTGARNSITEGESGKADRQPFTMPEEHLAAGKAAIASGQIIPDELAKKVAANPYALQGHEIGALVEGRRLLIQESNQAKRALDNAIDTNQPNVKALQDRYFDVQDRLDTNRDALVRGGREQASAFYARTMGSSIATGDFAHVDPQNLASEITSEARRRKGTALTMDEINHYHKMAQDYVDLQAKIDQANEIIAKNEANKYVNKTAKIVKAGDVVKLQARRAEIVAEIKEIANGGVLHQDADEGTKTLDLYHGTKQEFSGFDQARSRVGGIVFATPDKEFAGAYGDVKPITASYHKLFDASRPSAFEDWGHTAEFKTPEIQARMRRLAGELEDSWEDEHYEAYGIQPIEHNATVSADDILERIKANDPSWSNYSFVEDPAFIDYLKSHGFDAIKMRENGADTYGFFKGSSVGGQELYQNSPYDLSKMSPKVQEYAENLLSEGLRDKNGAIVPENGRLPELVRQLRDVLPDGTSDDEIHRMLSGYGLKDASEVAPRTDLQSQIYEMKTQANLIAKINDAVSGIDVRGKKSTPPDSAMVAGLRKSLADVQKIQRNRLAEPTDPSVQMTHRVESLLDTLEHGHDPLNNPKTAVPDTEKVTNLKAQAQAVQKYIDDKWGDARSAPAAQQRKLVSIQNQIAAARAQLEGGYRNLKRGKVVDDANVEAAKKELSSNLKNLNLTDQIHDLEEQLRTGMYKEGVKGPPKVIDALTKQRDALQRAVKIELARQKPTPWGDVAGKYLRSWFLKSPSVGTHIALSGLATQAFNEVSRIPQSVRNMITHGLMGKDIVRQGASFRDFSAAMFGGLVKGIAEAPGYLASGENSLQRSTNAVPTDFFQSSTALKDALLTLKGWKSGEAPDVIGRIHGTIQQPFITQPSYIRSFRESAYIVSSNLKENDLRLIDPSLSDKSGLGLREAARRYLIENPTDEMKMAALDEGVENSMLKDNKFTEIVAGLKRALKAKPEDTDFKRILSGQAGQVANLAVTGLMPVVKPGSNAVFKAAEASPIGVVRSISGYAEQAMNGKLKDMNPLIRKQLLQLMDRGMVGTALIGLGTYLYYQNSATHSYDGKSDAKAYKNAKDNATGLGSLTGIHGSGEPGALQVKDSSVPLRYLGFVGKLIQIGVDMAVEERHTSEGKVATPSGTSLAGLGKNALNNMNPADAVFNAKDRAVKALGGK